MDTPLSEQHHVRTLKKSFSAAASSYLEAAGVQERVAAALLDSFGISDAGRVLEVGCGSGMLTLMLTRSRPGLDLHALDISPRMIEEARRRSAEESSRENAAAVHWIVADFLEHRPTLPYDLVISSSALHWLHPLQEGLHHVARLLAPGGRLVCAVMVDGTLGELRESRLRVAPDKPPAGRLPSGAEFLAAVAGAGLDRATHREADFTSTYASATELLHRLRKQGVTGGLVSRSATPLTRRELRFLTQHYESRYRTASGGVIATYRVLFVEASKTLS